MDEFFNKYKLNEDDDRYFLKLFSDYDDNEEEKLEFTYQSADSPELKALREALELDKIAGNGDELTRIVNLRSWVHHTLAQGRELTIESGADIEKWDTLTILKEVRENGLKCDCGAYALVLTEVLLAVGIKSKWVQCLPMDLRYMDSHCVTHVFSESLSKWIIMDAAMDLCYLDTKGVPLSIPELRTALLKNNRIFIPSKTCTLEWKKWLINYWRKNIIRFHCYSHSRYGFGNPNQNSTHYYLNPKSFVLRDKDIRSENSAEKHINTSNSLAFWTSRFI